jgi:hypothetical protein
MLTSAGLVSWTFGGDRLSIDAWRSALTPAVVTSGIYLLPVGLFVALRRERFLWAWFGIALTGPIVFMNLYAVHAYYSAAITPAVAALIGGGLDVVLERRPRIGRALLALPALALVATVGSWSVAYTSADPDQVLPAAAEIAAAPPGSVGVQCPDWDPAAFFYARRSGFIAWDGVAIPAGYQVLGPAACPMGRAP